MSWWKVHPLCLPPPPSAPPTLKRNTNADEYSLHTKATGAKLYRPVGDREPANQKAGFSSPQTLLLFLWNNSTRQTAPEYKTHYWYKKKKCCCYILTSVLFSLFRNIKDGVIGAEVTKIRPDHNSVWVNLQQATFPPNNNLASWSHAGELRVTPLPPSAFEMLVWLARSRGESMKRRKQVLQTPGWLCELSVSVSSASESQPTRTALSSVSFKTFNLDVSKFLMKRNCGTAANKIKQTANNCPWLCFKLGMVETYKDTGRV